MLFKPRNPAAIHQLFAEFHASDRPLDDRRIDALLGITSDTIDSRLDLRSLDTQFGAEQFTYEGTPYEYVRWFLHRLEPTKKDVIYDLGSGYGRVVFYGAMTTPAYYKGIEIVPERVVQSNAIKKKLGLSNAEFICKPVLDYDFSDGTIFFLFNPFAYKTFRTVLDRLEKIAQNHPIKIIAWGGGQTELLRLVPWLHDVSSESDASYPFDYRVRIFYSI